MNKYLLSSLLFIGALILKGQDDLIKDPNSIYDLPIEKSSEKPIALEVEKTNVAEALNRSLYAADMLTSSSSSTSTDYNGVLEGSHSVSQSGSFNYTIPITVAPGIKGVEPNLSLTYSSQSGDGLVGYGWNISGLSTISRIPSTQYHNGYMDPVDLDHNDQFALDGQRLILKPGTTNEYQTENFSNIKVVKNTGFFTVYYPDGSKAYYGFTSDSKSLIEWAISKWEDVNGNTIDYKYFQSHNTLSIHNIRYGHRSGGNYINEVIFNYKPRGQAKVSYINGHRLVRSNILSDIQSYGNHELLRKYKVMHFQTPYDHYDRLYEVIEYNKDNNPKPGIRFISESNGSMGMQKENVFDNVYANLGGGKYSDMRSMYGDFDGNGKQDFLLYDATKKDKLAIFEDYFHNGTYGGTPIANLPITTSLTGVGLDDFDAIFPSKILNHENKLLSDYNAITLVKETYDRTTKRLSTKIGSYVLGIGLYNQGTKDFVFEGDEEGVQEKFTDSPEGVSYKNYISGDFNGDGISDLLALEKPSSREENKSIHFVDLNRNLSNANSFKKIGSLTLGLYQIQSGDYNGDGKTDIYIFCNNGKLYVYTLSDTKELIQLAYLSNSLINIHKPISVADFNGDGKTDFVLPNAENQTNWTIFYSKSNGEFEPYTQSIDQMPYYKGERDGYLYKYIFSDFTSDGKTDFLTIKVPTRDTDKNTYGYFFYNKTNPIFKNQLIYKGAPYNMGNGFGYYYPIIGLDQNTSDSTMEIGFYHKGSTSSRVTMYSFLKDHIQDTTLDFVWNMGNNKTLDISYTTFDRYESGTYSKDFSQTYPFININSVRGFRLVEQLEDKSKEGIYRKQDYQYYGAISHAKGLGFLGFKGISKTNWYTSGITRWWSTSLHDSQLRGAVTDTYTASSASFYTIPSNAISKEHYDYTTKLLANPSSKHFEGIPVDLTLNQVMNNTFKIASRRIRLTTGFKAQGSKGKFKASIAGNPDQNGASGYAGVYIGFPTKVTSYDKLTGVTNTKTYAYDSYWNPTVITTGHGNVGTTQERFEYLNNPSATSGYYMARVKKQTDKSTAYGGSFQSTTEYTYDSKGRATRIVKKGNGGSDSLEEFLTYDAFGNVKTRSLKGTGVSARNEKFDYDPSGRFVTSKTNVEGLITTYKNKATTGLLESETSHLGLTTSYTYDNWNRPLTVTDYLGKTATYAYKGQTDGGFWVEETNAQNTINKKTYYDKHGRVYREKTLSLNNDWISVDTQYDALDRKVQQSEPYINGSPTQWTITKYDQYGRIYEAIAPTGRKMTTSYDGLKVSVNDQVQTKTTVKDAMGNTLSNEDHGGKITYSYFPNGNMKSSSYATEKGTNTIVIEQDHWGRKIKLTDPSAGVYQYTYNVFGENLEEINPKGKTTTVYDTNGRVIKKTIKDADNDYTVNYVYDATTKLLKKVNATTDDVNSVSYFYDEDNHYKLDSVREENSRAIYTKKMLYDDFGRTASDKVTAKSKAKNQNFTSTINYNYEYGSGILEKVTDASDEVLYQVDVLNERAQVTAAKFGNDIVVDNQYDQFGYLTKQSHRGNFTAMDYDYKFDKIRGNLLERKNYALSSHYAETFSYDSLDRLTTINATSPQSNMTYEKDGRIKTNSTVGTYAYKSSGSIFQLADIDLNTKGKQLFNDRELQEAQFASFKKPTHIKEEGNGEVWFEYNGGLSRSYAEIKKEDGSEHLIKHYSADQSTEIIEDQLTGKSKIVHYFGGPYESNISYIAQYNAQNSQTKAGFHYLHRDYLGSLVAISDQNGTILEKRHYGAWGKLEKYESNSSELTAESPLLTRGWTGHEHFAQVSLVHMNGRMYDADLGRFLAPDNYVQDPSNTQNFNRYQYAFNNPLKWTDPSGEAFLTFLIGAAITGALIGGASYAINAAITGNWSWGGFFKSIAIGGITGALSYGIGSWTAGIANGILSVAANISAHAITGGIMSEIEGGSFFSGALAGGISAGIAKSVSGALDLAKNMKHFVKAAIMTGAGAVSGGIGSVLAGGNFWSGFRQGAITAGLNHAMHYAKKGLHNAKMKKLKEKGGTIFTKTQGQGSAEIDLVEFNKQLKQKLIESGFSKNIQVVEYSMWGEFKALINGTPTANVTIRSFYVNTAPKNGDTAGYATPGSNNAIVYGGGRILGRYYDLDITRLVNVSVHELGHAIFSFQHSNSGIMYPSYGRGGTNPFNFNVSQSTVIKNSIWGQ